MADHERFALGPKTDNRKGVEGSAATPSHLYCNIFDATPGAPDSRWWKQTAKGTMCRLTVHFLQGTNPCRPSSFYRLSSDVEIQPPADIQN